MTKENSLMSNTGINTNAGGGNFKLQHIDRRSVVAGGLLALSAAVGAMFTPSRAHSPYSEKKFESLIPARVGPWRSRLATELILPPEDELSKKLYENLQTRIYENRPASPDVMFLIAYSSVQQNEIQVHRPEVCYPIAGYPIVKNEIRTHRIGNVDVACRFLVADRQPAKEMILYWTRVGKSFALDWAEQRIDMAMESLRGKLPDGVLARFSMISDDEHRAEAMLVDFANIMASTLDSDMHQIFFGR